MSEKTKTNRPSNGEEALVLEASNLKKIGERLKVPRYDRDEVKIGIAHLGVGNFHRSHQAVYTDAAIESGGSSWGILGVGLRPEDAAMRGALRAQDYLYSVVARSGEGEEAGITGALKAMTLSAESPEETFLALSSADVKIVSLTVTEAGYYFAGDSRSLDFDAPDIRWDLESPSRPKTVYGLLYESLRRRRAAGIAAPTVLSCDNIPHNGLRLRESFASFCRRLDPGFAAYVEGEISFPCTMVDRITPATTEEQKLYLRERYGVVDERPVFCEDFLQWVIEDSFPSGRPDWGILGAQFVSDVAPYEIMKIRLLNGSHSALAYAGYLAGHRDVDAAMKDPLLRAFVEGCMREIVPTVGSVPGVDLGGYTRTLVKRFSNPAVGDKLARLAQDGSKKIPFGIAEPLKELLLAGKPFDHTAFALAAWIRYLRGRDEAGEAIEIKDPLAAALRAAAEASAESAAPFFAQRNLFPPEIGGHREFLDAVSRHLGVIRTRGTRAALESFLGGRE